MGDKTISLAIVFGVLGILTVIGIVSSRSIKKKSLNYQLGGMNFNWVMSICAVCALWIQGGMSIAELGFKFGLSAGWYQLSVQMMLLVLGFTVVFNLRKIARTTLPSFYYARYDLPEAATTRLGKFPWTRVIGAIPGGMSFWWMNTVGIVVAGSVFEATLGIPIVQGMFIAACAMTVYIFFGGMVAAAINGAIFLILGYLALISTSVVGLTKVGGLDALLASPALTESYAAPLGAGVTVIILWFVSNLANGIIAPTSLQSFLTAKGTKAAMKAAVGCAAILIPSMFLAPIVGMLGKHYLGDTGVSALAAYPTLVGEWFGPIFGGLLLAGLVCGGLAVVTPNTVAGSTVVANDFIRPILAWKNIKLSDTALLWVTKILTLSFVWFPFFIGQMRPEMVAMIFVMGYAFRAGALMWPTLFGLYSKKTPRIAALLGMIIGMAIGLYGLIWWLTTSEVVQVGILQPGYIALIVGFVVTLLITFIWPRKSDTMPHGKGFS